MADETAALDFDLACSYRLLVFDNERENAKFKVWGAMLGGAPEEESDDEDVQVW